MTHGAKLIPDFDKFTGPKCRLIRLRFGVHKMKLISAAGCTVNGFDRWEGGQTRRPWGGAILVYDVLARMCADGALRLSQQLAAIAAAHEAELAKRKVARR